MDDHSIDNESEDSEEYTRALIRQELDQRLKDIDFSK